MSLPLNTPPTTPYLSSRTQCNRRNFWNCFHCHCSRHSRRRCSLPYLHQRTILLLSCRSVQHQTPRSSRPVVLSCIYPGTDYRWHNTPPASWSCSCCPDNRHRGTVGIVRSLRRSRTEALHHCTVQRPLAGDTSPFLKRKTPRTVIFMLPFGSILKSIEYWAKEVARICLVTFP